MITINGDVYITNYGQPINEIVGDELEFDDNLDCDGNCELCDSCEEDEYDDVEIEFDLRDDDRFADYPDEYIELLSSFVEEAYKIECPHCLASLFDLFLEIHLED